MLRSVPCAADVLLASPQATKTKIVHTIRHVCIGRTLCPFARKPNLFVDGFRGVEGAILRKSSPLQLGQQWQEEWGNRFAPQGVGDSLVAEQRNG
jgi:hypothetical protein